MKRIYAFIVVIFILFIGLYSVSATEIHMLADLNYADECTAFFGDPEVDGTVAYYMQMTLDIIKYAGIVLCIVLTIVEFFKALFGEDKDMYKNLVKKASSRLFYAVLLFFLPEIVKVLLTLIDVYGTCGLT